MSRRYDKVYKYLKGLPAENYRRCPAAPEPCACMGCIGYVDSKMVTDYELELFESGEMKKIIGDESPETVLEEMMLQYPEMFKTEEHTK